MTTFDTAHRGDKIQIAEIGEIAASGEWTSPIRLLTEPARCDTDCLCCNGITVDGRVFPVHARTDRLIRVLETGSRSASELATRTGDVLAEHADREES